MVVKPLNTKSYDKIIKPVIVISDLYFTLYKRSCESRNKSARA